MISRNLPEPSLVAEQKADIDRHRPTCSCWTPNTSNIVSDLLLSNGGGMRQTAMTSTEATATTRCHIADRSRGGQLPRSQIINTDRACGDVTNRSEFGKIFHWMDRNVAWA